MTDDPQKLIAELEAFRTRAEEAEQALQRMTTAKLTFGPDARPGQCAVCKFWRQKSGSEPEGTCHRKPPAYGGSANWPVTRFTDFCGEFKI